MRHRTIQFEPLEDRRMMAVDFELVKNINATPNADGSNPAYFVAVGETLYFTANDGVSGIELWKCDGTEAGTVRVKDIHVGVESSFSDVQRNDLINIGGTLFFRADDGVSGNELWKSDGTEAGTVRVKDIQPGSDGSRPFFASGMIDVGGTLFFTANDGASGDELWKSDGTEAGTVLVKDVQAGAGGSVPDFRTHMVNVGGTLFFSTDGDGLWKSDGSEAGTVRVRTFPPAGYPKYMTNVGGTIYFNANNGAGGRELWKSDGTEAGTVRVKDIQPGLYGSAPYNFTNVGGTLFFTAADGFSHELWKSNGTAAGTIRVKDIKPGGGSSGPGYLTNVGGTLLFRANDGTSGYELWKSDGTAAGTVVVKDIGPGPEDSSPRSFSAVGGTLYFSANDGASGYGLWSSDGTEAGTVLVENFAAVDAISSPSAVFNAGGKLFVAATTTAFGRELWVADLGATATPGDYDVDGDVDGADLLNWQRTLGGAASPAGSGADGDGTGVVDAGDLGVWQTNFGASGAAAVPVRLAATLSSAATATADLRDQVARDAVFAAAHFSRFVDATDDLAPAGRHGTSVVGSLSRVVGRFTGLWASRVHRPMRNN